MDGVPVEVNFDAMLETGPGQHARVGRGGVNHYCATCWPPAVVNPVVVPVRAFGLGILDVVMLRAGIPDVYRALQLRRVMARDVEWQLAAGAGVRFDVLGDLANAREERRSGFVGQ